MENVACTFKNQWRIYGILILVFELRRVPYHGPINTCFPFLLHSHSLLTHFLLFSSLYLLSIHHFTPPLILRVTLGYSGYSVYSSANHLGFIIIITCLTHLIFILHPCLYSPVVHYPLTYFTQLALIYSKLLTYFISSTHLYIFSLTCTSLTYLVLILFCISYPTLLPLLVSPLSKSLSHQNITYPYIHNPTKSFIITQNITPKPFHFLFIILYSLFPIKTWTFTALFHILHHSTQLYYHFHYSQLLHSALLSLSLLPTFPLPHSLLLLIYIHFQSPHGLRQNSLFNSI